MFHSPPISSSCSLLQRICPNPLSHFLLSRARSVRVMSGRALLPVTPRSRSGHARPHSAFSANPPTLPRDVRILRLLSNESARITRPAQP